MNHKKACDLYDKLKGIKGLKILNQNFFNEFTIEVNKDANLVNQKLLEDDIISGYAKDNKIILAVSELTSEEDMKKLANSLEKVLK